MMKKVLMVALLAALTAPVMAQANVGVVDIEAVIKKSNKGKAFFEELDAFKTQKKSNIDNMVKTYREKQKDVQAKAASLSEDKKQSLALELQNMQTNIKRAQEDAERETQVKVQSGLEKLTGALEPLVRQVALEKDLHLVLQYGAQSGIVFFHEKIDITEDVIKKFNE
ncbi:MAG: OmpH family outer membrane protein [Acidobacteriota bacterium]|nr:OmpH family outer membrane protein [Acidobacteriota bacterium]